MIHMSCDVYCHWSEQAPSYRVYVDNDMLVERTFRWPGYQNYVKEHIICKLDSGLHVIRIENCSSNGKFTLDNFVIEGSSRVRSPGDPDDRYTFRT